MSNLKKVSTDLQGDINLTPDQIKMVNQLFGTNLQPNVKDISGVPVEESTETNKVVIPKGMSKLDAAKELQKQHEAEENYFSFVSDFEGWNWKDVLVAIKRVTEEEFGWMNGKASWFSGSPKEIDVVVNIIEGRRVVEKAFYGDFQITAWENASASVNVYRGNVQLYVEAKKRYGKAIGNYFDRIREKLITSSIYRGKNIVVSEKNGNIDFEIIENKGSDKIVLNEKTQSVVNTFVLGDLKNGEKRCYLFTGDYGNGKTETAMYVGKVAVEQHGQSFFYLKDAKLFDEVLNLCKKYAPAVLFMEDVDEIAAGEQRDETMNKILNTLDGVQTKGNSLTVIFTTNHVEKLNKALRRPGRIDLILKFDNPDSQSREKILRSYIGDFKGSENINFTALAGKMPNAQGAVIAEISKRAKKLAQERGETTEESILACIASMEYQIELMKNEADTPNEFETYVKLQAKLLGEHMYPLDTSEEVAVMIKETHRAIA